MCRIGVRLEFKDEGALGRQSTALIERRTVGKILQCRLHQRLLARHSAQHGAQQLRRFLDLHQLVGVDVERVTQRLKQLVAFQFGFEQGLGKCPNPLKILQRCGQGSN
ncbi:hypothetical protein D3C80_1859300 [compost metagenome]